MAGYIQPPIETDPDDLSATALDTLMASIPGWIPRDAHLEVWLIQVLARMVAEARDVASAVPRSIFRYFGKSLLGLPAVDDAPATVGTTWTMVDAQGYTVREGTVVAFRTAGDVLVPFRTTAPVVVSPGNTTTAAGSAILEAIEPGPDANGLTGPMELVDALAFVASVTAPGVTSGGVEAESDAEYLDRLAQELELLTPRPILPADFAVLARRVPGVFRALAVGEYLPGTNEVQTVNVTNATAGTFTLTFDGQTTAAIAHNATAAAVRSALEALSNVGTGTITTGRGPLGTDLVEITFGGRYLYTNVPQITGTPSLTGRFAAVTIDPNATANNEVRYTAKAAGAGGNAIRVAYTVPAASTALSVAVAGNDITVTLATDAGGLVTSTALQVRDAVNAHAGASALVGAALPGTTTGAGVVAAVALTNLAGGADPALTTATTTAGVAAQTNVERTVSVAVVDEAGNALSQAVKDVVAAELNAQREINFVVRMLDPTYTRVSVRARFQPLPGYATGPLITAARDAVAAALDKANWGGGDLEPPEWNPTANRVRLLEVGSIIDRVPGVDYVDTPSLLLNGTAADVVLYGPAPLPVVGTLDIALVGTP